MQQRQTDRQTDRQRRREREADRQRQTQTEARRRKTNSKYNTQLARKSVLRVRGENWPLVAKIEPSSSNTGDKSAGSIRAYLALPVAAGFRLSWSSAPQPVYSPKHRVWSRVPWWSYLMTWIFLEGMLHSSKTSRECYRMNVSVDS